MRNVLNIEARKIFVPEGRMRPVNAAWVEKLRESIQKGQLLSLWSWDKSPRDYGLSWTERTDWPR